MIFVFGSNEAGIHGAGAARYAKLYRGATQRVGVGMSGNSYAIPTKDRSIKTLPIATVREYVEQFLELARESPEFEFQVTKIGCGLAGFTDEQISPMFYSAPSNCLFDAGWKDYLPNTARFWGSFND